MRVAVVGGGVAGLCALKTFKEAGHDVELFEKRSQIGGVWAVTYPGAALQNTYLEYQYTDFPWEPKNLHPTAPEVLDYLEVPMIILHLLLI